MTFNEDQQHQHQPHHHTSTSASAASTSTTSSTTTSTTTTSNSNSKDHQEHHRQQHDYRHKDEVNHCGPDHHQQSYEDGKNIDNSSNKNKVPRYHILPHHNTKKCSSTIQQEQEINRNRVEIRTAKKNTTRIPLSLLLREEEKPPPEIIVSRSEAKKHDVLCGRGNGFLHHPGNLFYLKVIKEYQMVYQRERGAKGTAVMTNKAKRSIVEHVIRIIHQLNPPGRFLKFVGKVDIDGRQEEIYHVVHEHIYKVKKVSQALREKEKPKKKTRSKKKQAMELEKKTRLGKKQ